MIRFKPSALSNSNSLSGLESNLGRYDEAIKGYDKALEIDLHDVLMKIINNWQWKH